MKRMNEPEIFELGEVLKKYRESKALSQRDICIKLGYRNINFISMIEKGGSLIPIPRILDFCDAYQLSPEMGYIIFAVENPAAFKAIMKLDQDMCKKGASTVVKNFEKSWEFYLKTAKELGVDIQMVVDELMN